MSTYTIPTIISKWHKIVNSNNRYSTVKYINESYSYKKSGWCRPEHFILYNFIRNKPITSGFVNDPKKVGKRFANKSGSLSFIQALFQLEGIQMLYKQKYTTTPRTIMEFMQPFWSIGITTEEIMNIIDSFNPNKQLDKYVKSLT